MKKFIIIDGNSLINRAFYALPPLNTVDGIPSQAVYGFATMLIRLITTEKPHWLAVAFDMRAPTFRHKKFVQYKATRKGMPEELAVQMPLLKEMLRLMDIEILEKEGYEADDIIGTLSKHAGAAEVMIVTGDRDALQLIDPNISVVLTKRGITEVQIVTVDNIVELFGLDAAQIIDFKALCGDASDNIPGIAGVGEKTAMTLLQRFNDLDTIYAHVEDLTGAIRQKVINGKEMAYMSKDLATIDINVPMHCDYNQFIYQFPFSQEIKQYFLHMNFRTLLKRDEIFLEEASVIENKKPPVEFVQIHSVSDLVQILADPGPSMAFHIGKNIHFAFDSKREYVANIAVDLIDTGMPYDTCLAHFENVFKNGLVKKIVLDAKRIKKDIKPIGSLCNYRDVALAQYLVDMTVDYSSAETLLYHYGVDKEEIATGLLYVFDELERELDRLDMQNLYYDIELPLVEILFDMEMQGFKLDQKRLDELAEEFGLKMEKLTQDIYDLCGKQFNINSPKQLAAVLFLDLKIPYPRKSKNYSTSADILQEIADQHPVIPLVLEYRTYFKLKSTYLDGLRKLMDERGYVHTDFRQTLTTTGRLSSVEPNLQNIPIRDEQGKILREIFIAKQGRTLVTADYSQIELRLLAHFSQDETMLRAYQNHEDIHTSTASEVFAVPPEKVTSQMRRDAKAVNFGIIYGISDYGLSQNLKISPMVARRYIESYFAKFQSVKAYQLSAVEYAKKRGYAETLLHRKRKIPELASPNYNVRQFGERVAMNMPLQGTAADIIKIAMINVSKALSGMNSRLILQVHDELIIDADDNEVETVKQILKQNMESSLTLTVPLEVDISSGKRWSDCKK